MAGLDSGETIADRFRRHAGEQTHLYGYALRGLADDYDAGGPTKAVVAGYEDTPDARFLHLRLLAGVFRLVLTGRAPELVPYYPCLGGTAAPEDALPVLRRVIAAQVDELRAGLSVAPQTNEVGRSVPLLVGLFDVVRAAAGHRVRLWELGASAGLNLLVSRFRIDGPGWAWGPADSPVRLHSELDAALDPPDLQIVAASGCDLAPIDAGTEEGRVRLTSFVWPFDLHRHERLAGALKIAAEHPPRVDQAAASSWLADRLVATAGDDVLPVVWHSVTQLYWPAGEVTAVGATLV